MGQKITHSLNVNIVSAITLTKIKYMRENAHYRNTIGPGERLNSDIKSLYDHLPTDFIVLPQCM